MQEPPGVVQEDNRRSLPAAAQLQLPDNLFKEVNSLDDSKEESEYPVDFEKFYEAQGKELREGARDLYVFPSDEVVVASPTREYRTVPVTPLYWTPGISKYVIFSHCRFFERF